VTHPEIVHPEEPALKQVGPQVGGLALVEKRPTRLAHHDERAPEERGVRQPDDDRIRIPFAVLGDARPRQLHQPDRQILVGPGVIHEPAIAIPSRPVSEPHPAEAKTAVVVGKIARRIGGVELAAGERAWKLELRGAFGRDEDGGEKES
jgi:hypothetical protein